MASDTSFRVSASSKRIPLPHWTELEDRKRFARRLDFGLQVAIAALSIAAAYMVASTDPQLQRWGFVVGLVSQPFWILAAVRAHHYGVVLVAIFYTGAWIQGIANRFF